MKAAIIIVLALLIAILIFAFPRLSKRSSTKNGPASVPTPTSIPKTPLEIVSPTLSSTIGNTLSVSLRVGQAPADVSFRLTDAAGKILVFGTQHVDRPEFIMSTNYFLPTAKTGVLDISLRGDPQVISIPINFPAAQIPVQVYFYNSDCETLQGTYRLVKKTTDLNRSRLDSMIAGPTTMEVQNGLRTALGPAGKISLFKVVNNIAAVNFTNAILARPNTPATTAYCPREQLPYQVKNTLFQDSRITDVTIAIDNKIPSNLQP